MKPKPDLRATGTTMAIDSSSVGYRTDPVPFEYAWRDVVLYALSVGAQPEGEFDFLYEGAGPKVLPTFAGVISFAVFDPLVDRIGCDRGGLVHERQSIRFHRELPSAAALRVTGKVDGLYDLRRMAMGTVSIEIEDGDGLIAEAEMGLVFKNDGDFGGPRPPKRERVTVPDRAPDFIVEEAIPKQQALLYRLNGDHNPLHADPEFAARVGFDAPILHGLCTFGYAGRAVLRHGCDGDPARLTEIHAQFREPVIPGDSLVTRGWSESGRVLFQSSKGASQSPSLASAYAIC